MTQFGTKATNFRVPADFSDLRIYFSTYFSESGYHLSMYAQKCLNGLAQL